MKYTFRPYPFDWADEVAVANLQKVQDWVSGPASDRQANPALGGYWFENMVGHILNGTPCDLSVAGSGHADIYHHGRWLEVKSRASQLTKAGTAETAEGMQAKVDSCNRLAYGGFVVYMPELTDEVIDHLVQGDFSDLWIVEEKVFHRWLKSGAAHVQATAKQRGGVYEFNLRRMTMTTAKGNKLSKWAQSYYDLPGMTLSEFSTH